MKSTLLIFILVLPFAAAYLFRLDQRFERWVERADWRRTDGHLSLGATFVIFSSACILGYAVLMAWLTGAFTVAAR